MKFKFSFLIVLFCVSFSFAQLSVTSLQGNVPFEDGDVFTFDTNVFEDAKLKYLISNSSTTETIGVKIEVVSFNNTDGTNLQLCVQPSCFFDIIQGESYPGSPIVLGPGEDNGNFDYFSNTNPGDGENYPLEYVLRFFTVDANGDELGEDITVTYLYDPEPLSTQDFELSDLGIELQNSLVNQNISISATTQARMELFNISGKSIQQFEIGVGSNNLEVSNVSAGVLIAVFTSDDGKKAVTKLIKQ